MKWLTDHRMQLWGFAIAVAYVPEFLAPGFTPRWVVILAGVALLASLDVRSVPVHLRWVILWVMGLAAIATTWASPDPMGGYLELFFAGILCLTFVAGSNLDSLDSIMTGFGVGLLPSSVMVVMWLSSDQGRTDTQLGGLFVNREILAELSALVLVWAVVKLDIVIAVLAAVPVLVCQSRIAMFVTAVGLFYAYRPRSIWKASLLAFVLCVAGAGMLVFFGLEKAMSADHRLVIWLSTIYAWTQFGHGLGWFQAGYPVEEFAHSDAIQAVAEIGLGAFALLAIPFTAFFRNRGTNAERALFAACCVELAVSFPLHLPASGFIVALCAGYLVSDRGRLRVRERIGGYANDGDIRWTKEAGAGIPGYGGYGGRGLPVRSAVAREAALREVADCQYPGTTVGAV